jgi:protein-disulfide isomerase
MVHYTASSVPHRMYYLRRNIPIVIAVILSCVIIAITYVYAQKKKEATAGEDVKKEALITEHLDGVRGIQADDHILGNPKAPITIYVYSDFGCPYCADYHETIRLLMRTYGSEGKVAIVYRHLPLVQLHPEAPMYALASECVAKERGSFGFWAYADDLFGMHDPLEPLTAANLVVLAEKTGVSRQAFVACMRANELMAEVEKDYQEAIDAGAEGSPFTIIEAEGTRVAYQGAQSYRSLGIIIQTLQRKLEVDAHGASTDLESGVQFADDMDEFDMEPIGTSSKTNTVQTSTSTATKNSSILDGIIEEEY